MIIDKAKGLYYNYHRWYNPETGRYIQMERIDKIGHIDYGRGKWINALYMTAQLNNSFVYSYNSPARWVDILGLRPGDVFYDYKETFLDAVTYIYEMTGYDLAVEWGTGIKPVYVIKNNRCIEAYTYSEPYGGEINSWDPYRALGGCEAVILLHIHTEGYSISPADIGMTQKIGEWYKNYWFSVAVDPDGTYYRIDIDGSVSIIR